jgi:hypothetical protein
MQLDPEQNLRPQLEKLSDDSLEAVTAAVFASLGFLVFRNLPVGIEGSHAGQDVGETDVFAVSLNPLRESRIVIECKGGQACAREARAFASLRGLLEPPPDELVLVCSPETKPTIRKLAQALDIRLIDKTNFVFYVLPFLQATDPDRGPRVRRVNRYLAWQVVHDFLSSKYKNYQIMKDHNRFLGGQLWPVTSAADQLKRSFDEYKAQYHDTIEKVAAGKGTTALDSVRRADDDDVQAAMYLAVLHRVMNAYAVARRCVELIRDPDAVDRLVDTSGPNIRGAISKLSSQPAWLSGFPAFLQTFFFVWGGFVLRSQEDWELAQIAADAGATPQAGRHYLEVLHQTYLGDDGASMLVETTEVSFFKWVPAAFEALGTRHRRSLDSARYKEDKFYSEESYDAALNRALEGIGGTDGLRY